AICSDVYLRAPAALSIMIRELWSTSSLAIASTRGPAARKNNAAPTIATPSIRRLNFARSPTGRPPYSHDTPSMWHETAARNRCGWAVQILSLACDNWGSARGADEWG